MTPNISTIIGLFVSLNINATHNRIFTEKNQHKQEYSETGFMCSAID